MQLYLVRHGEARDSAEAGTANGLDRALSVCGVERTRLAATGLARLNPCIVRIVSSPLLRAGQTAAIFSEALGLKDAVETLDALSGESGIDDVIQWIKGQSDCNLMLVGHMPSLAVMISRLVCGSHELAATNLKEAGVCRLSFDGPVLPGTATLEWLIPSTALGALAGE